MPVYQIKTLSGRIVRIDGPDDLTPEELAELAEGAVAQSMNLSPPGAEPAPFADIPEPVFAEGGVPLPLPEQRTASVPEARATPTLLQMIAGPETAAGIHRTLLGAGRNAVVGLGRLPFDLVTDPLGITDNKGGRLSRLIPTVNTEPTSVFGQDVDIEKMGQEVLPFAFGGVSGAKGGLALVPKTAGLIKKGVAALTGAATGDAAVVDPSQNAGTIGDLLKQMFSMDTPTARQPDDSPAVTRLRQGGDAASAGIVLSPLAGAARGVVKIANLIRKNFTTAGQEDIVGQGLKDVVEDAGGNVKQVVEDIDNTLTQTADTGFKPTTAQASGDAGLVGLQRDQIATDPLLAKRTGEQDLAISQRVEDVTGPAGDARARRADAEAAQDRLRAINDKTNAAAAKKESAAEQTASKAEDALSAEKEGFDDLRGRGTAEDASAAIDDTLSGEVKTQSAVKRQKFNAIDPAGTVEVPESLEALSKAADDIVQDVGRLADGDAVPSSVLHDIKRLVPESAADDAGEGATGLAKEARDFVAAKNAAEGVEEAAEEIAPLTFKELQELRPRLSDAIRQAGDQGKGKLAENLSKLKEVVNNETKRLASEGTPAGERAKEAGRFFKDEFAPKFRQGEGEKFAASVRKGTNVPTRTASKFIKPNNQGGREAAQQLKRILADAPNPQAAEAKVRDYFVGRLVDMTAGDVSAVKITRFIQRHSEALKEFPEVRKEFFAMRNRFGKGERAVNEADAALKKAIGETKDTAQSVKDMAATRFFIEKDPVTAIEQIIKSDNPARDMRKLLRETRADPTGQARKGVQAAIGEWFQQTARSNATPENFGQIFRADADKFSKLMREGSPSRAALEQAFTPEELATLEKARKLLLIQNRATVAGRSGASGLADAAAVADRGRIFSAALFGIVKGRGVFTLSKLGLRATGQDPVKASMDMLRKALLEPDLAKALMMRVDSQIAKKRLNAFLGSNIVSEAGQDREE